MKPEGGESSTLVNEDKKLAGKVARGNEAAFRQFFDHYYPRIYRFCARRLDEAAAQDAAQTVMIQAVRKINTYRGEAALLTWLTQIARNAIKAEYRSSARHSRVVAIEDSESIRVEVESLAADPLLNPETIAHQQQRQQIVQLILDHLPGSYGSVLEWKYVEGLSVGEIAKRLDTTVIATQSMLARARRSFKEQYDVLAAEILQILDAGVAEENGND